MASPARPRVLSRWVTHTALAVLAAAVLATPASRVQALPHAATSGSLAVAPHASAAAGATAGRLGASPEA